MALAGILAVVWIAGYGYEASRLARDRRRPPLRWFVYGGVLGPLGIRILRLAPPGSCNTCLNPVVGWSIWCSYCGCDSRENWDRPAHGRRDVRGAGTALAPVDSLRRVSAPASTVAPPIGAPTAAAGSRSRRTASVPTGRNGTGRTAARKTAAGKAAAGKAAASSPGRNGTGRKATSRPGRAATGSRLQHLASAVFVEGSIPLERGTRYLLTVYGDDLRIVGTATSLPGGRILSRRLREVQMTSTAERLVVAGISERLAGFRLVFNDVRNDPAMELSGELAAPSPAAETDASVVAQ